jgi:hypothetical protein
VSISVLGDWIMIEKASQDYLVEFFLLASIFPPLVVCFSTSA